MQYRDTEYNIAQYLLKPKKSGKLQLAHLKCLKPGSNDYNTLQTMQDFLDANLGKKDAAALFAAAYPDGELIDWTDAEFDMAKVRDLFLNRGLANSQADFDDKVSALRLNGDIHQQKLEALLRVEQRLEDVKAAELAVRPHLDPLNK